MDNDNKLPHNGAIVQKYMTEHKVNRAALGRKINSAGSTILKYFESPSLQTGIFWKLSIALQHNFLAELAEQLPVDYTTAKEVRLRQEIETFKEKIALLEKEIEKKDIELSVYKEVVQNLK